MFFRIDGLAEIKNSLQGTLVNLIALKEETERKIKEKQLDIALLTLEVNDLKEELAEVTKTEKSVVKSIGE